MGDGLDRKGILRLRRASRVMPVSRSLILQVLDNLWSNTRLAIREIKSEKSKCKASAKDG